MKQALGNDSEDVSLKFQSAIPARTRSLNISGADGDFNKRKNSWNDFSISESSLRRLVAHRPPPFEGWIFIDFPRNIFGELTKRESLQVERSLGDESRVKAKCWKGNKNRLHALKRTEMSSPSKALKEAKLFICRKEVQDNEWETKFAWQSFHFCFRKSKDEAQLYSTLDTALCETFHFDFHLISLHLLPSRPAKSQIQTRHHRLADHLATHQIV